MDNDDWMLSDFDGDYGDAFDSPIRSCSKKVWYPTSKSDRGQPKFRVGQTVKLKNGTAPVVITEIDWQPYNREYKYQGIYVRSQREMNYFRFESDLEIYEGEEEMATQKDKLYQVKIFPMEGVPGVYGPGKSHITYATYLATNSQGQWVMEEKGTGKVLTVYRTNVEEVVPYTVEVQFIGGGQTYSYTAAEGQYEVDAMYVMEAPSGLAIIRVVKVGTKSKAATKELKVIGRIRLDPVS